MKFNIQGTELKIEFSFLLVIAVSILLGNFDIIYVILFSALHETGHLVALIILRQKADKITVSYYGIGLKYRATLSTNKELVLFISGIAVNLFFVIIDIHREINGPLFLINALPIYPLDGGRILKLVLNSVFSLDISDKIYLVISVLTMLFLFLFSVVIGNISLVLIIIYSLLFAINNFFD